MSALQEKYNEKAAEKYNDKSALSRIASSPMYTVGYFAGSLSSIFQRGTKDENVAQSETPQDTLNPADNAIYVRNLAVNMSFGIAAIPGILGAAALSPVMTAWTAISAYRDFSSQDSEFMPSVKAGYRAARSNFEAHPAPIKPK